MIDNDTVRLLRECDAGAAMGVGSINDVLGDVRSPSLRQLLTESRNDHDRISKEIRSQLHRYDDAGKRPGPVAETMSRMETRVKLAMGGGDRTVADLMTDGCNMGVKSLSRYLNQYRAADAGSRDAARRLIAMEARLAESLRAYL